MEYISFPNLQVGYCLFMHHLPFPFVYGTHLIILAQLVVGHGEEPGGALQRVGAAGLQVEGAQAPVLQLTHEVLDKGVSNGQVE